MADYRSIIVWAVSHLPSTADEARHAIYEQARTALHKRLANDPLISDAELVNEHHRLEVAIYEVEEDLLLRDMRRFVREETALSPPSLISKIKEFVRSAGDRLGVFCRRSKTPIAILWLDPIKKTERQDEVFARLLVGTKYKRPQR